jgi:hypothetical protein
MTTFPNSPRLLKGGLILVDPGSQVPQRIIVLQYNADTLTRTLTPQAISGEGGERSSPLRLKAPATETIKLEAEIDATDQLEFPDQNPAAVESGIHRDLAALETILYPPSERLRANNTLASLGTLEIAPVEAPLTLFVWGPKRIVPVRLNDFSITEEAFDPALNPIRAKVSLGLKVLTYQDLGLLSAGGALFMAHQVIKEVMATIGGVGTIAGAGSVSISATLGG